MGRGGVTIKSSGSFQKVENFLAKMLHDDIYDLLDQFGRQGVDALAAATPVESGITAEAWYYEVNRGIGQSSIVWHNSHMDDNGQTPVVILIQYGHGTGTGGFVSGQDFINPAIQNTMNQLSDAVWKAVQSA